MFPKRSYAAQKGAKGQSFFEFYVINTLESIYHPIHQENDSGIDGYIELVLDGNVTGKLVGVQIKHGNSFFKTKTNTGYKFTGDNKHLNYYLNQQIPIFIIILDDDFKKILWVKFDIKKISSSGENHWTIEIPDYNNLNTNFKETIFSSISPIIDFNEAIEWNLALNSALNDSDFKLIAIPKKEVISMSFNFINDFIERLSGNKNLLLKSSNSLSIFFPEYDDDSREIFQIPEIKNWIKESIKNGIPWFYFLNVDIPSSSSLSLLIASYCDNEILNIVDNTYHLNYSKTDLDEFINTGFHSLNTFTDEHHLELDKNKEVSEKIINYFQSNI